MHCITTAVSGDCYLGVFWGVVYSTGLLWCGTGDVVVLYRYCKGIALLLYWYCTGIALVQYWYCIDN